MPEPIEFARDELQRAGLLDSDSDYGGALGQAVLELFEVFDKQGHSGFSANMAVSVFERLARLEPLSPLTGDDDEWMEVGEQNGKPLYQNRRCSHVFKEGDYAYDIEGKVFREPDGACFTSGDSFVSVTFPYTPTREYVDVPAERH